MSRLEEYQVNLIMSMSQKKVGGNPFPVSAIEDFCRNHWPEKRIGRPLIEFIIKIRQNDHIPAAVHHSTGLFEPKVAADFLPVQFTPRPPKTSTSKIMRFNSSPASCLQHSSSSPSEYQLVAINKNLAQSLGESRPGSSSSASKILKINTKTFNDTLHEMGLTPDKLKSEIAEGMATEKLPAPKKHKHVFLAELTGFTITELYMGQHATPFTLHTRLLCENSGFFARLLCQPTTTQDRCFIGVDPKVFAAIYDWLYRDKLPDVTVDEPEAVHLELLFRMNVYRLAHQLDMPALKDNAMTDIVRGFIVNSMLPNSKEIEFAYEMTTSKSTLRQYIARMFQFMLHTSDTPTVDIGQHPTFTHVELKAFLVTYTELDSDVFNLDKVLGDTDEWELKEMLDPRLVFICDFHEHEPGYDGCRWVGYTAGFFHGEGLKLRQKIN